MNAGMNLAAVYVAGAILVAGCGQSNSGSAGVSPSQPAAAKPVESKPTAPKDATIKVKGLYIGMDIQTVPALLKEKLAGKDWIISDAAQGSTLNAIFHKARSDGSNMTDAEKQSMTSTMLALGASSLSPLEPEYFFVGIVQLPFSDGGKFVALPDRKVGLILLNGSLVNDLFNAADMDASAFVKQFISAYDIPEMKVSDNLQSWTYTSPDGVKVTIDTQKKVSLEKVASAQDRKQSFN